MTSPSTYKLGFPKQKNALVPMASSTPFQRDPTTTDVLNPKAGGNYAVGTMWVNGSTGAVWYLSKYTAGVPTWTISPVLPTTGTAARKGTSTFVAGVSPAITTTAVAASSVIVITRTNIAGVTIANPLGHYFTITPGVSFVVTANNTADTSTFT